MNGECVRLTVPARPEFVGVARLTLAGVAARLGFDVDAAEDFKLAVAEGLNLLLRADAGADDAVELVMSWTPECIEIQLGRAGALLPTDDDEAQIASLVMAEFMDEAAVDAAAPQVRLLKRRQAG